MVHHGNLSARMPRLSARQQRLGAGPRVAGPGPPSRPRDPPARVPAHATRGPGGPEAILLREILLNRHQDLHKKQSEHERILNVARHKKLKRMEHLVMKLGVSNAKRMTT